MMERGEYRLIYAGLMNHPPYLDLPPRSKWVLTCAMLTLPAPFPSALDVERIAASSGISVASVRAGIRPCLASGLLVQRGELFDFGTVDGHTLVRVPSQFHARVRRVRRRISRAVRDLVFQRDGYRCRHCGRSRYLELDHVEPWALGGSDEPENLQTLCSRCNRKKGPSAFITRRIAAGRAP